MISRKKKQEQEGHPSQQVSSDNIRNYQQDTTTCNEKEKEKEGEKMREKIKK
jgi:hypothetical protein